MRAWVLTLFFVIARNLLTGTGHLLAVLASLLLLQSYKLLHFPVKNSFLVVCGALLCMRYTSESTAFTQQARTIKYLHAENNFYLFIFTDARQSNSRFMADHYLSLLGSHLRILYSYLTHKLMFLFLCLVNCSVYLTVNIPSCLYIFGSVRFVNV